MHLLFDHRIGDFFEIFQQSLAHVSHPQITSLFALIVEKLCDWSAFDSSDDCRLLIVIHMGCHVALGILWA
jgi:hypothetical protein